MKVIMGAGKKKMSELMLMWAECKAGRNCSDDASMDKTESKEQPPRSHEQRYA